MSPWLDDAFDVAGIDRVAVPMRVDVPITIHPVHEYWFQKQKHFDQWQR